MHEGLTRDRRPEGGLTKIRSVAALIGLAVIVGACASNPEYDEDVASAEPRCPSHMTMTCYKRTAEQPVCRCEERREMRRIMEESIRRNYP